MYFTLLNTGVWGNAGYLSIRLFSVITRTFIVEGFYLSAEMQSVYSIVLADWAHVGGGGGLTSLQRCLHFHIALIHLG